MFVLGSIDIEGVKQRPDEPTPWMFPGGAFYPFVNIEFLVQFLTYWQRIDKYFEGNITTTAIFQLANKIIKDFLIPRVLLLHIPCKPYSWASSKSEFADDLISVLEHFPYSSRVILGSDIARDGLFFNGLCCWYPDEIRIGEVEWCPFSPELGYEPENRAQNSLNFSKTRTAWVYWVYQRVPWET